MKGEPAQPAEDRRSVLVTGAAGQDGTLLTRQLLAVGFEVHGVYRSGGRTAGSRSVEPPVDALRVHTLDLTDLDAVRDLLTLLDADVVVNLAAQSSVARSWQDPEATHRINADLPAVVLEWAARRHAGGRRTHVVQASSAEIFAPGTGRPLAEDDATGPVSPYGQSKLVAHELVQRYRAAGLPASNLVLFPHESPLRQEHFVTRRITRGVARIAAGIDDSLDLGNLSARRDWGWAEEYTAVVPLLLERDLGDDFVLATGVGHSVGEFAQAAFAVVGIADWQDRVRTSQQNVRPRDVDAVVGDPSKARRELTWSAHTQFEQVVARMVAHDVEALTSVRA